MAITMLPSASHHHYQFPSYASRTTIYSKRNRSDAGATTSMYPFETRTAKNTKKSVTQAVDGTKRQRVASGYTLMHDGKAMRITGTHFTASPGVITSADATVLASTCVGSRVPLTASADDALSAHTIGSGVTPVSTEAHISLYDNPLSISRVSRTSPLSHEGSDPSESIVSPYVPPITLTSSTDAIPAIAPYSITTSTTSMALSSSSSSSSASSAASSAASSTASSAASSTASSPVPLLLLPPSPPSPIPPLTTTTFVHASPLRKAAGSAPQSVSINVTLVDSKIAEMDTKRSQQWLLGELTIRMRPPLLMHVSLYHTIKRKVAALVLPYSASKQTIPYDITKNELLVIKVGPTATLYTITSKPVDGHPTVPLLEINVPAYKPVSSVQATMAPKLVSCRAPFGILTHIIWHLSQLYRSPASSQWPLSLSLDTAALIAQCTCDDIKQKTLADVEYLARWQFISSYQAQCQDHCTVKTIEQMIPLLDQAKKNGAIADFSVNHVHDSITFFISAEKAHACYMSKVSQPSKLVCLGLELLSQASEPYFTNLKPFSLTLAKSTIYHTDDNMKIIEYRGPPTYGTAVIDCIYTALTAT
jgi:hypothetical protein